MTNNLAVDVALLARREGVLSLLAIERAKEPFKGCLALPGGFVEQGEYPRVAAARELEEETGVTIDRIGLRWLRFCDAPGRDPRGKIASIVFYGVTTEMFKPKSGSDARAAKWLPALDFLRSDVAFDHRDSVVKAISAARAADGGSPGATRWRRLADRERRADRSAQSCVPRWGLGIPQLR